MTNMIKSIMTGMKMMKIEMMRMIKNKMKMTKTMMIMRMIKNKMKKRVRNNRFRFIINNIIRMKIIDKMNTSSYSLIIMLIFTIFIITIILTINLIFIIIIIATFSISYFSNYIISYHIYNHQDHH